MYTPKLFNKPRADNPDQAAALIAHRLHKRYPFLTTRGYDRDYDSDFRTYGLTVRPDKLPIPRAISWDTAFFFLHSQWKHADGTTCYTFIHMIVDATVHTFRALVFTDFSEAYRYAYSHGCTITKAPMVTMSILDFLQADTEDVDLFASTIDTGSRTVNSRTGWKGGMTFKRHPTGTD